jgi:hypothetical protein
MNPASLRYEKGAYQVIDGANDQKSPTRQYNAFFHVAHQKKVNGGRNQDEGSAYKGYHGTDKKKNTGQQRCGQA